MDEHITEVTMPIDKAMAQSIIIALGVAEHESMLDLEHEENQRIIQAIKDRFPELVEDLQNA